MIATLVLAFLFGILTVALGYAIYCIHEDWDKGEQ